MAICAQSSASCQRMIMIFQIISTVLYYGLELMIWKFIAQNSS